MFKELISFWKDDSALKHIFQHFDEMLVTARIMFKAYKECSLDGSCVNFEKKNIIKMDSKLNVLQQDIRRDIVTHISVQGTGDIVPCLMMMTITKDAERLGDYVKNLFEIAERFPISKEDPRFSSLREMAEKIDSWFIQTKKAFDDVDKALAMKTREEAYVFEKKCDKIVWDIASEVNADNAVAVALQFRFFKRIIAHLANICTSVVMPLDKIDYYEPFST